MMMLAKKKAALKVVPLRKDSSTALNPIYGDLRAAFDALEQIDASPQVTKQIAKQTLRARDAAGKIWRVIQGMQLSEYFDPHVYAALRFEESEKRRKAADDTNRYIAEKKKENAPATEQEEEALYKDAVRLYPEYRAKYNDAKICYAEMSKALNTNERYLQTLLGRARTEKLIPPRFNSRPSPA